MTRANSRCATPATGRTMCAAWCGSRRRRGPLWRTATGCSRSCPRIPCSPTPLTQTARSLDTPLAALAAMRRDQALPQRASGFPGRSAQCGRRDRLLGALPEWPAAGCAAADLDAPSAVARRRRSTKARRMAAAPYRSIHYWARTCACGRNRSATCGRPRSAPPPSRGWAITGSAMLPCFPVRPTARWRWPRRAGCLARTPRPVTSASSSACCSMSRPRSAPSPRSVAGRFRLRRGNQRQGEQVRHAVAVLRAAPDDQPPAWDMAALLAAHPRREEGSEVRNRLDQTWHSVRSGVHRPGRRAHRRGGQPARCWPRSRCPVRSARNKPPYGVHPALLDACFQSVAADPRVRGHRRGRTGPAAGCASTARLRLGSHRPLLLHAGHQHRLRGHRDRHRCARRARDGATCRGGAAFGYRNVSGRP